MEHTKERRRGVSQHRYEVMSWIITDTPIFHEYKKIRSCSGINIVLHMIRTIE